MTIGDWLTEAANWVFLFLAVPTFVASLMVVSSKNVVRAVLYLVIALGGSAALFLMLGSEFVGWTIVLVYIGAVIILFLIGIMITRAPLTKSVDLSHPISARAPAALLSVLLFGVMAWAVVQSFGLETIPFPDEATSTGEIGVSIFTLWVVPFEVMSFVLLAALIGGIALARRDEAPAERQP
ncbi:MAG: NADH-quinone oxidoreductase subunit J [Acidimicrobiia bacterium]|nr:MAG: NADH-quinone oxidoreductase subunit J [Acidimicrobiia bacterium]